jgi:ABC-2 type transport system ATP-binding protein
MTHVRINNATIRFPEYTSVSRGFINSLFGSVARERRRDGAARPEPALAGLSLDLAPGQRLAVLGRNGAGKTTLLRLISGIYEPIEGSVEIVGSVSSLTDISMGMEPDYTGYENIEHKALFLKVRRSELDLLIREVEDFSELGDALHRPLRTFSSGMQFRLAFALATYQSPEILIMDEVIGAGDPHFREKARQRLERFMQSARILVLASHDMHIVRQFCNRAILLDRGQMAAEGTVEEVISRFMVPDV